MERKTLTITQVEEIKKVGDKQIPKLSFKAKDGEKELLYFTFKSSLFDLIKEGGKIDADVETSTREYDGNVYTDRRVVQVYVDGQPISTKNPYRGKSPEELELSRKSYALAYAKDLAVAKVIALGEIKAVAEDFYIWLKGNGTKAPDAKLEAEIFGESEGKKEAPIKLETLEFKNPGEFYTACLKHLKVPRTKVDAAIPEYDLTKADQRKRAWQQILGIYGHKPEGKED